MSAFKLIAIVVLISGCVSASDHSIEGVWRSRGWGYIYEIRGSALQAFEVTSTTCVRGFKAARLSSESPRQATFRTGSGDVFHITANGEDDHKRIVHPRGLTSIAIERLPALPQMCAPPTPDTPLGNFEVFARTFAENYISFDLRRIDWDQVVAQQRAKVNARTTPAQLFEILKAMIEPLTDIHTGIEAPKLKRKFDPPLRPGTERVTGGNIERFANSGRRHLAAITNHAYLRGPLLSLCVANGSTVGLTAA